jgi:hypothetical protein
VVTGVLIAASLWSISRSIPSQVIYEIIWF